MRHSENAYLVTSKARRQYAEELFNVTTIAVVIDELASHGHRRYRVIQEMPFDLSETAAAKELEAWLEQEDYLHFWRLALEPGDPHRPGLSSDYQELEIRW